MDTTLDTVKNSTLESSRMKKMPSETPKMARTMAGAAHDPAFAAKMGIPVKVAQDFNQADTGTAQLKQAMKERSTRARMQGGPPGAKDEATESPQEKAREKRLGIP